MRQLPQQIASVETIGGAILVIMVEMEATIHGVRPTVSTIGGTILFRLMEWPI